MIRDIYFFVHMIMEHISGSSHLAGPDSAVISPAGEIVQVIGSAGTKDEAGYLDGLSVNSGSSNFILGPLSFLASWLRPLCVGKFLPCWNQLGFIFSFLFFSPCDIFMNLGLQI